MILTELMEVVQADRKGRRADLEHFDIIKRTEDFNNAYKKHVKDTVEDELADAILRILSLAGYMQIDMTALSLAQPVSVYNCRMFPEDIYKVVCKLTGTKPHICLPVCAIRLLEICLLHNIDIIRHINIKMEYNRNRPYRHSRRY